MKYKRRTILDRYRRMRAQWRRRSRLLFPSPAEVAFIKLMGGRVLTFKFVRSTKYHFSLTLVLSIGRALAAEKFEREVRVGKCFVDFGNDIGRGIEIDGYSHHMDILAEQDRDDYLYEHGFTVMHIQARHIYSQPDAVRARVLSYLNH